MAKAPMPDLLERLRDQACSHEPFTSEHARCICRLTNAAADEIERLRREVRSLCAEIDALEVKHGERIA